MNNRKEYFRHHRLPAQRAPRRLLQQYCKRTLEHHSDCQSLRKGSVADRQQKYSAILTLQACPTATHLNSIPAEPAWTDKVLHVYAKSHAPFLFNEEESVKVFVGVSLLQLELQDVHNITVHAVVSAAHDAR